MHKIFEKIVRTIKDNWRVPAIVAPGAALAYLNHNYCGGDLRSDMVAGALGSMASGLLIGYTARTIKEAKQNDRILAGFRTDLGELERDLGNYDMAKQNFCKAIKSDKESSRPHVGLAGIYMREGKLGLATNELKRAMEKGYDIAEGFARLAVLYEMLGDNGKATYYRLEGNDKAYDKVRAALTKHEVF